MKKHPDNHGTSHRQQPLTGDTADKIPITMDGGRTIIFISHISKEAETREKYEARRDNRIHYYTKKPKQG